MILKLAPNVITISLSESSNHTVATKAGESIKNGCESPINVWPTKTIQKPWLIKYLVAAPIPCPTAPITIPALNPNLSNTKVDNSIPGKNVIRNSIDTMLTSKSPTPYVFLTTVAMGAIDIHQTALMHVKAQYKAII